MLKSSAAKSAASSPPVPARISSSTFFSSLGSFGISRTLISSSSESRRTESVFSSSSASARISASDPRASSSDPSMSCTTALYSRYLRTSGSISESDFAAFRYSVGSDCTSLVPRRCISSSYRASTVDSLSNIDQLSPGDGGQKRDLVAVVHFCRHLRVIGVDGNRHCSLVIAKRRHLFDQRAPHGFHRRRSGHVAHQLARSGKIAQPGKQPHGYAHAIRRAAS